MSDKMNQDTTARGENLIHQSAQGQLNPEKSSATLTAYERALAIAYSLREENAKMLSEFMNLKAENARLCENGKKLGEICLKDREEMAELKTENEALRKENERLLATADASHNQYDQLPGIVVHHKGLQAAVDALNTERDLLQPLVAVGVATRLRFLEKGKANATKLTAEQLQPFHELTAYGNQAGHCGNVLADTALFQGNMFDPKYESSLATIIEKLYRQNPADVHGNTSQMHVRVLNLLATLNANYTPPPSGQNEVLEKHWEDFGVALEEYGSFLPLVEGLPYWGDLGMATCFDGNREVYDLVVRLEKIGGDIITVKSSAGARFKEEEQSGRQETSLSPSKHTNSDETSMNTSSE